MNENLTSLRVSATQAQIIATPTDTSLTPESIFNIVREFYTYRPPTLVKKKKGHTNSEKTRPPAEFDKHLAEELQLRRIVYVPTIARDLGEIAGRALDSAYLAGSLPSTTVGFPTKDTRKITMSLCPLHDIACEKQVEEIYALTAANFYGCVAATLEFRLSVWSTECFTFTRNMDKTKAIADGFLTMHNQVELGGDLSDSDYGDMQATAQEFPAFAIWEFKSLTAGKRSKIEAIIQLARESEFPWVGCEHNEECVLNHRGAPGKPLVTGNKMGPDSTTHQCSNLHHTNPTIPDVPPGPIKDADMKSARHMMQQAWAEAVNNDATFIVINAGILEIICIRDRTNQTLYISDILEVDDCDYGRLHVGLFIAAYRDAKDRMFRLRESIPKPASWLRTFPRGSPVTLTPGFFQEQMLLEAQKRDWLVLPQLMLSIPQSYYIREVQFKEDTESSRKWAIRVHFAGTNHIIDQYLAKGVLEVDGNKSKMISGSSASGVMVKFAVTSATVEKLRLEHEVYLKLHAGGVTEIPQIIGFFTVEGLGKFVCAVLVMENAGMPVSQVPESFSSEIMTSFLKAVKTIHAMGYAHGRLNRDNLLIQRKSKKIAIVGFGSARRTQDPLEMQKDMNDIDGVWRNRLKRTARTVDG